MNTHCPHRKVWIELSLPLQPHLPSVLQALGASSPEGGTSPFIALPPPLLYLENAYSYPLERNAMPFSFIHSFQHAVCLAVGDMVQ